MKKCISCPDLDWGVTLIFQIRFEKIEIFDTLHAGWFATPRFSSLSGALMCDSKKAYHPSFVLGFFLGAFLAVKVARTHERYPYDRWKECK